MTKSTWAKIAGWAGGAITTLALNGAFGKYSGFAATAGTLLTGVGIHTASNTSAGHPNGSF